MKYENSDSISWALLRCFLALFAWVKEKRLCEIYMSKNIFFDSMSKQKLSYLVYVDKGNVASKGYTNTQYK